MSDDPMPSAPASISRPHQRPHLFELRWRRRLSSSPITCSRTVVAPMNEATFCETPRRSSPLRYSASVVQVDVVLDVAHLLRHGALLHRVGERTHRAAFAEDLRW